MTIKKVGSIVVGVSKMVGKLTLVIPGLYLQKKRGVTTFQAELRGQGLDDEVIATFSKMYGELGDLKHWLDFNGIKES